MQTGEPFPPHCHVLGLPSPAVEIGDTVALPYLSQELHKGEGGLEEAVEGAMWR